MKPTQKELTNWALTQIKENYEGDIALLIAIEGHSLENDCHGLCFDYFVPANENGNKLAQTFIIDGVGHDLYPRSWKRIEDMANFDDDFTYGLGNAIILYSRSEEDRLQFVAMQEKQISNMHNKEFMFKKALQKLDTAMELYQTMMFEDDRYKVMLAAGYIAYYLSLAVACINETYFKQRLDLETVELAHMKDVPDNFISYYEAIVKAKSVEELKNLSYMIINTTREFISKHKQIKLDVIKSPIYEDLAGWYEEGSLTWRRIYYHCDKGNYNKAFPDAIRLQRELNIIKEEFGLHEMDLLGSFDSENLISLKNCARKIELYIISEIESHCVVINKYDTLDEFLKKNS